MPDEHRPDNDPLDWPELERRLQAQSPRYDSGAAWAKLERAMDERTPPADVRPFPTAARTRRTRVRHPFGAPNWAARVAAVLVLGGGVVFAWRATRLSVDVAAPAAPAAMREVTTGPGQRATIRLVDGTRVELGAGSRLRYAPEFGGRGRDVYLDGEAYFDVVHDERRPFAVHTAHAVVRDLGTEFNVRGYADVSEVEVAVAKGAVVLTLTERNVATNTVLLHPGDLGRVEADGRLVARRGIDVGAQLAWMEGRLVFVDAPLREVIPRLARWYGADIRLGDSTIANRRYTASLKDETLPQLLDLMTWSLELRIERRGNAVVFYPKSKPRRRSLP